MKRRVICILVRALSRSVRPIWEKIPTCDFFAPINSTKYLKPPKKISNSNRWGKLRVATPCFDRGNFIAKFWFSYKMVNVQWLYSITMFFDTVNRFKMVLNHLYHCFRSFGQSGWPRPFLSMEILLWNFDFHMKWQICNDYTLKLCFLIPEIDLKWSWIIYTIVLAVMASQRGHAFLSVGFLLRNFDFHIKWRIFNDYTL